MSNFARMFANGLRFGPQQQPMRTGGVMPPQSLPMQTGGGAQQMPAYGMQTGGNGQQQPMPMMQTGGQGQQWGQLGMQTGGGLSPQPGAMSTGGQSQMWRQPQPTSRLAALQQRFDQAPQWQPPGGFNYNRR